MLPFLPLSPRFTLKTAFINTINGAQRPAGHLILRSRDSPSVSPQVPVRPCETETVYVVIPEADNVHRRIPPARSPSCFSDRFRITKPLTFADCVGDELPLGWEEVYDQQVGVYYIDHINSE